MSATGLEVFDRTLQATNTWLKSLMGRLATENRPACFAALRATLHALRDRLPVTEAAQLGAQLPILVRGVYYEGWQPARTPVADASLAGFLAQMRGELRMDPKVDMERLARAVLAEVAERVTPGEIADVIAALPPEIRPLWPKPAGR